MFVLNTVNLGIIYLFTLVILLGTLMLLEDVQEKILAKKTGLKIAFASLLTQMMSISFRLIFQNTA